MIASRVTLDVLSLGGGGVGHSYRPRWPRAAPTGLTTPARWLVFAGIAAAAEAALILAASASAGTSPVQVTSATVHADRKVSISWNIPVGTWGGVFVVNRTPTTDSTGEMPFVLGSTIEYDVLGKGWTNYKTRLPLKMTVQQPVTVYGQVQLIDPYDNGTGGCQQGVDYMVDCDSQIVALTITPICSPVLIKAGYYSRKRVRSGHWLKRNGHYVRRHTHRVWVKATFRRIYHAPVHQTQCH